MDVESDKDIVRDILDIAEEMHAELTSQDRLDDELVGRLRKQGAEMDRLADQL